ncbi:putative addiction module antidote protein [Flammeovirga sp. MY04]|uniref:addiction module antidote protein n=1 Tax=Flammeovirga sp. MY04 TaxID=1191459 RepID=UPI0008061CF1|nr:addiction module antidote protein [Flammeovirga sp. MY04]ANQ49330.1 putative addiction module antidote protein [Flammeovirga sp. MY04]
MKKEKIKDYKNSNYFDDLNDAYDYLKYIGRTGDAKDIVYALNDVVKFIGVTKLSEVTGLNRNSLYKTLSGDTNPKFDSIIKIIRAIEAFMDDINKKDSGKVEFV